MSSNLDQVREVFDQLIVEAEKVKKMGNSDQMREVFDQFVQEAEKVKIGNKMGNSDQVREVFDQLFREAEKARIGKKMGNSDQVREVFDQLILEAEKAKMEKKMGNVDQVREVFDQLIIEAEKVGKKMKRRVKIVLPFKLQCHTCGRITDKWQRFDASKEKIGMDAIFDVEIYRYKMKCPTACLTFFTLVRDPGCNDYIIEEGASVV